MLNELSPDILSRLPSLYATESTSPDETIIQAHFFLGNCDWFAAEFDGEDTFFGFVCLGDPEMAEWGYFSLSELKSVEVAIPVYDHCTGEPACNAGSTTGRRIGAIPVSVEWDSYWKPKPFGKIEWR